MVRDIDLIHYLPLFVQEYREIKNIMNTENPEFQLVVDESEVIKNNQFILTCNETGIARYEKIIGIIPSPQDTLQSRISRVMNRWNDTIPYTWKVFLQKMRTLCGEDFTLVKIWNEYKLIITTHLDLFGQVQELERIIGYMIPANIETISENILNYSVYGNAVVGSGIACAEMFQLTDSYNIIWAIPGTAYPIAAECGSCEIMMTDSSQNDLINSEAKSGAYISNVIAEQIEVSDTYNSTIYISNNTNAGFGITYTENI